MRNVFGALVRRIPNSYDNCVRRSSEKIDVELARIQQREYCRVLMGLGVDVVWIPGYEHLPDCCFIEDVATVTNENIAILCRTSVQSRKGECDENVTRFLQDHCSVVSSVRSPAFLEGGDVLRTDDKVFIGLSSRTNREGIKQYAGISRTETFGIPIPEEALHLKSISSYLGNNYLLVSERLDYDFPDYDTIMIPAEEEYASNCLFVNGTVLMPKGFPKTKKLLKKEKFDVKELDVSEIRKGDGSLSCLSILL